VPVAEQESAPLTPPPCRPKSVPIARAATHCPYGRAEYWSVRTPDGAVHADLASAYRTPLPEGQKIAGLIAFYNETVEVRVDGVPQERPVTKFS
jgi:uncharacterized protein (DUF427 family)